MSEDPKDTGRYREQDVKSLIPRPDPSTLTTEALTREITYLRILLEAQVEHATDVAKALRAADEKFEDERDRRITETAAERDRRLTEVATEREKALKIKEEADKEALRLDREIRQFKDEKAGSVTDSAVAGLESKILPIERFMVAQQGRQSGIGVSANVVYVIVTIIIAAIVAAAIIVGAKG